MISTKRLIVRKFTKDDCEDLYEYLSLDSIYKYEPGEPITLEEAKEMAFARANVDYFYAVELKSESKVIGHIYFDQMDPVELKTWIIGYIFNPKYQRKGYATESSKALIEYSFSNFNTHRVIARCNPKNIASWKVLEKLGMKREGRLRKNTFRKKNGYGQPLWCDTYQYAILEEDL